MAYDCRRCGACCKNLPENVQDGFVAYVAVEKGDAILGRRDLMKKLVVLDDEGAPHLRLDASGRCLALQGALGRSVSCRIYHLRPSPCRRVEPGSALCLRYMEAHGIAL